MMFDVVDVKDFKYRNSYKVLHQWHNDDFEQSHKIFFRIRKFFEKRKGNADARETTEKKEKFK